MAVRKKITNWGNYPKISSEITRLHDANAPVLKLSHEKKVIARGNGRCYGDASLGESVISTLELSNFIEFDAKSKTITCEAGVLLSDLLEFLVPKGFFIPVTPGTKFITVGGAIAADVHGKNHHKDGCFSSFVESFKLFVGPGEIIQCSPAENDQLFYRTFGAMGLTGIVLSVTFKVIAIETSFIYQESIKASNLDEIFALFEDSAEWKYTVAWIDCLQKGKSLGRSIIMRGESASLDQLNKKQAKIPLKVHNNRIKNIPFYFPSFVLNSLSVKLFNWAYYLKQFRKKQTSVVHYDQFFYPLDSIGEWNKIYGKPGFIQYQFVLPMENSKAGMRAVLEEIANSGLGSFLAVLKLFGENDPRFYNSFPIEGYTLALDFKYSKKLSGLVERMDQIVLDSGGRIYRAKDCMSRAELTNYIKAESDWFGSLQSERITMKS